MVINPSKEDGTRIEDSELDMKEEELDEEKLPVAAQIEVLYDIQQSFRRQGESEKDNEGEDKSESKTKVWVGVFEGWLNGNPDGSGELRWKLVLNRHAWEFPLLSGYH